jgi:hypothetical protein
MAGGAETIVHNWLQEMKIIVPYAEIGFGKNRNR